MLHTLQRIKTTRILLVDESDFTPFIAKTIDAELHCTVDVTNSLEKTLALLDKQVYDIILIDICMQQTNSIDIAQQIRRHPSSQRDIPILGCSIKRDIATEQACFNAGMQHLIPKPLTIRLINETLTAYVPHYQPLSAEQPLDTHWYIYHEQIIDHDELKTIFNQNETIKLVLEFAKKILPMRMAEFKQAYQTKQWKSLSFIAYQMRSDFSYVAAMRFIESVKNMENYLIDCANMPEQKELAYIYSMIIAEAKALEETVNQLCRRVKLN